MSSIDIIELRKTANGEKFYPQSHVDGMVGNETIAYLGEVTGERDVEPGPSPDPTPTPSEEKKLSVSQRKGVIVGRCIPLHPRKGKKYFFADGIIKVKGPDAEGNVHGERYIRFYNPRVSLVEFYEEVCCSHQLPFEVYGDNNRAPVVVTITEESLGNMVFNLATMANISYIPYPRVLNSATESPYIDVIDGKVIVTKTPIPKRKNVLINGLSQQVIFFSKNTIAFAYRMRMGNVPRGGQHYRGTFGYRRVWAGVPRVARLPNQHGIKRSTFRGLVHVFDLRRGRRSKNYYAVWRCPLHPMFYYKEYRA